MLLYLFGDEPESYLTLTSLNPSTQLMLLRDQHFKGENLCFLFDLTAEYK